MTEIAIPGREPSGLPARADGEAFAAYLQRLEAWRQTEEGRAFEAGKAEAVARANLGERQRQQRELIKHAGLPNRYVHAFRDERPPTSPAIEALVHVETLTALGGDPGCGKTTAACWWLMQYIVQPTTPRWAPQFITAAELARMSKFDQQRVNGLLRCPRLVVDDLGMEYLDEKGAFLSMLDEIVNGRYAAELPLVMTTNLTAAEFSARYGDRIVDRIREAGGFVELSNKSYRGRSA